MCGGVVPCVYVFLYVCVVLYRDLDQASMEAVVSLLAGLPLQPEEGDGVELMEAKSQLFLKSVHLLPFLFLVHFLPF